MIKFRWVGINKHFKELQMHEDLTTEKVLNGKYLSFFSESNRIGYGNCEFLSEDLFTGIKDKNEIDIYAGDIVRKFYGDHSVKKRLQGFEGVVKFGEFELTTDSWGVTHKCYGWHLEFDDKSGCTAITSEMEIIGNVYANELKRWKEKIKEKAKQEQA